MLCSRESQGARRAELGPVRGQAALTRGRWAGTIAAAALVLGAAFLLGQNPKAALAGRGLLLLVAAFLLWHLLGQLRDWQPRGRRRPSRQRREMPESLVAAQDEVSASRASVLTFDRELQPLLRQVAASALARRGISLASQPERSRQLLGDDGWRLLMERHPQGAADRRGPQAAELKALLDSLEGLER